MEKTIQDQQALDALISKIEEKTGAKIDEKLSEALKGLEGFENLNPDGLKNLLDEALKDKEKVNELTEQVKNLGLEITAMKEEGTPSQKEGQLIEFMKRENVKDSVKSRKQGFDTLEIKVAALMTTANVIPNVPDGFNQLFGNFIDTEIHSAPKPDNYILPLVEVIQGADAAGTENIWYVDRVNEEGDAEFINEGDLKPLADAEYQESKTEVKEVALRWKMSNRLIMHAPSVVSDFRRHATELVEQKIDDGVSSGDGVGPNLAGIQTLASPFVVPTNLANYYTDANIWDVIMAVATYVRLNNFKGELTCVLNTVWMAQMKGIKNSEGDYIAPPFVTPDGRQVGEVRIVFTNKIDADKILLGELKRFKVVISENVMYYEGWENDDFGKNLQSRKLEAFMGTYLPISDTGSIIFDDISTVLTAIEAVEVAP